MFFRKRLSAAATIPTVFEGEKERWGYWKMGVKWEGE